jgi:hypothetical protein
MARQSFGHAYEADGLRIEAASSGTARFKFQSVRMFRAIESTNKKYALVESRGERQSTTLGFKSRSSQWVDWKSTLVPVIPEAGIQAVFVCVPLPRNKTING